MQIFYLVKLLSQFLVLKYKFSQIYNIKNILLIKFLSQFILHLENRPYL